MMITSWQLWEEKVRFDRGRGLSSWILQRKKVFDVFIFSLPWLCYIVFKILKLFPDKIEHAINLRDLPHKHVNLKFSSNDVQWNPKEGTLCVCVSVYAYVFEVDCTSL